MGKKKRTDMTQEELAHVRKLDREKQQRRRMKLSKDEKDEIKKNNTERRAEARKKLTESKKERFRINKLISMRKYRLLQNEKDAKVAKYKAKEGMRLLKKEGPIMKYLERKKKHISAVKWRKFLSQNPFYKELEERKKKCK